ncbi:MAG TPA: proline racemase family protein [Patescibacteria group bacterium]|jgi:proline racemase|nr:proline racemase family protein [Patescibacteria group bacterium]
MTTLDRPVRTVDYHTAGEPFRIVTAGVPELEGRRILDRRRWAKENLDDVRRLLVNEPRGHADMYGCFVTPPDDDWADLGVVFFHNEGYSTACGHGTIALVTWAIDSGRIAVEPGSSRVSVTVDVPSGRLACEARLDDEGKVEAVRFRNVPSFVLARDVTVRTSRGPITVDVAYGGAFYATLEAASVGLGLNRADLPQLIALQRELRPALERSLDVVHPAERDLAGIYGVIFWERIGPAEQRNVAVFANGEIDRSPCGSGTSARLAVLRERGELAIGEPFRHRSLVDSAFEAWVVDEGPAVGRHRSVITEVEGSAYRTGESMFSLDPRDPLGTGFLLR